VHQEWPGIIGVVGLEVKTWEKPSKSSQFDHESIRLRAFAFSTFLAMTTRRFPPPWFVDHSPNTRRRCSSRISSAMLVRAIGTATFTQLKLGQHTLRPVTSPWNGMFAS